MLLTNHCKLHVLLRNSMTAQPCVHLGRRLTTSARALLAVRDILDFLASLNLAVLFGRWGYTLDLQYVQSVISYNAG